MSEAFLYGQTQTERETINGIINITGNQETYIHVSGLDFKPEHIMVVYRGGTYFKTGLLMYVLYDNGDIKSCIGASSDYGIEIDSSNVKINIKDDGFDLWQESFHFTKGTQYYYEVY